MNFLFGAEISCPLSVLQRVRIIEVIFTKNVWAFSRDQVNCPYQRGVRIREVFVRRGSTVLLFFCSPLFGVKNGTPKNVHGYRKIVALSEISELAFARFLRLASPMASFQLLLLFVDRSWSHGFVVFSFRWVFRRRIFQSLWLLPVSELKAVYWWAFASFHQRSFFLQLYLYHYLEIVSGSDLIKTLKSRIRILKPGSRQVPNLPFPFPSLFSFSLSFPSVVEFLAFA